MRTRAQNRIMLSLVFLAISAGILRGVPEALQALSDVLGLR